MRIVIAKKIESQNRFNNRRGFASQFFYKKYRDEWFAEIMAHLPAGSHNSHENKKRVVIIRSYRTRLLDRGNLYGGSKPILDALVFYGVLRDDSPAWCMEIAEQTQVSHRDDEKTEISIWDDGGDICPYCLRKKV